jgi:ELP3 family radical SAM enzyme/protein acetyltransferase
MSVDIEDLNKNNNDDINLDKYRPLVKKLYEFVIENCGNHNLKQLFIKRLQKTSREFGFQPKKSILVKVYGSMVEEQKLPNSPLFWKCIQKKPVRNTSGVNPITLMYSPYPNENDFTCRFKCKYCQTHPEYPKSYGPEAPASARGIQNDFEAIAQMNSNLRRLRENGHELDKLELNYEGGTFSEIPKDYIIDFHRDTYYAANVFLDDEKRPKQSLNDEMALNQIAKIRIIGMTIETRPDTIDAEQLKLFRALGVTRVQIGVQHTNDDILIKSNRGHTYEQAVYATHLLKTNGFKVVHHYMIALPYSTPEDDIAMLGIVYSSTRGRPHEIKIYPYSVVGYSAFQKEYEEGKFNLYSDEDPEAFRDVMKYALEDCPPDIRICRAVRDIPTTYILGGCSTPNLRQLIMEDLEKEGKECSDMRSREISRRDTYELVDAKYYVTKTTHNDYLISLESVDRRALFGFLRLRLNTPGDDAIVFPELYRTAIIEELHVYSKSGMLVPVGQKKEGASQHCGVGKTLIKKAEWQAWLKGYHYIAVISGEGVREYYKNQGYDYHHSGAGRFMIKEFKIPLDEELFMTFLALIFATLVIIWSLLFCIE